MNKFKLLGLIPFLISGLASATPVCDGFQLKIANNLADNLLVTSVKIKGAKIQPSSIEKLDSKAEQVFTINSSNDNSPIHGEFILHTISVPFKTIKLKYSLESKGAICEHRGHSVSKDFSIQKTREVGQVSYTISGK
jgi:hypothetical protein